MKNYKKMFNDANLELIRRTKITHNILTVLLVLASVGILCGSVLMITNVTIFPLHIIYGVLCVGILICSIRGIGKDSSKKKLKKAAKEFALGGYYNDLRVALEHVGSLRDADKKKLRACIAHTVWLDKYDFDPSGFSFDYKNNEKELFILIDPTYSGLLYLKEFEYSSTLGFIFTFDKVNRSGSIEDEVYIIPIVPVLFVSK